MSGSGLRARLGAPDVVDARRDAGSRVVLTLRLPKDRSTVATVRHLAIAMLRDADADDEALDDVALAVSEICANVIQHSGVDDDYEVRLEIDGTCCALSVRDSGRGPTAVMHRLDRPHPLALRGRGLVIVRAAMDAVSVKTAPNGGTVVQAERGLRSRNPPRSFAASG
jgi:serine/threonine-protein kinase RsbW